jgi:hypothetical protein
MRRRAFCGSTAVMLLLLYVGCAGFEDEDEGEVPLTEIPLERQKTIEVRKGYVEGKGVEYYRMGTYEPGNTNYDEFPGAPVHEMYVWLDPSGRPSLGLEQLPIIDTLPLQVEHTDFFEIVGVTPPGDYEANAIKSRGTLLRAAEAGEGFEFIYTNWVVNCPVVGPNATLEKMEGFRKLKVWYRKKVTHCIMMDGNRRFDEQAGAPSFKVSSTPHGEPPTGDGRSTHQVPAREGYFFQAKAFRSSDFVTGISLPGNDIFRYTPANKNDYSPLVKIWDVEVPADYQVGSITSYGDLFPIPEYDTDRRITERTPEAFCNCPIMTR